MSWSYCGDPSANDKDAVRFLISDTDIDDQLLQDEEILYLLAVEGTVCRAAYRAALALVAKFAKLVNESVGSISVSCGDKHKNYLELCKRLKIDCDRQTRLTVMPYAGGLTCSDKDKNRSNSDRVVPAFSKHTLSPDDRIVSEESDDCNDCD